MVESLSARAVSFINQWNDKKNKIKFGIQRGNHGDKLNLLLPVSVRKHDSLKPACRPHQAKIRHNLVVMLAIYNNWISYSQYLELKG